ncbi:TPA: HNH endonuclease [Bacillus pseudomycoides]|nr:HNH endonuclease [Bacillus pseudomycoides]
MHCHHIKPWLALYEVNKVPNLATVCQSCHLMIHEKKNVEGSPKTIKKIEKFQHQLTKETADYNAVMNVSS